MTTDWETLAPILVHIQANLESVLSLETLSRKAGVSSFHFQRLFKAAIGETPKAYTQRLRLERAAFRLSVHDSKIVDVAMGCGFGNHETFTRAFRRRYGKSPAGYRQSLRNARAAWREPTAETPAQPRCFEVSPLRIVRLQPLHLAFRRHTGPYESVPESLFTELEQWAARGGLPGPPVWVGIGHDAPGATAPEHLRFDAALRVPGPFAPEGRIAYQLLEGGEFAMVSHAGPYETLPAAYEALFPRLMALRGYRVIGLPAVEFYHTARVNTQYRLNHTDICLPVERL